MFSSSSLLKQFILPLTPLILLSYHQRPSDNPDRKHMPNYLLSKLDLGRLCSSHHVHLLNENPRQNTSQNGYDVTN